MPSKSEALEVLGKGKEDSSCTLPIETFSKLKMQHVTKAVCIPMAGLGESPAPMNASMACLEALAAAGATKAMSQKYMLDWPDEANLANSPYDRRPRDLIFRGCFEMGELREGRFKCGDAKADKIVRISKKNDKQALVRYARTITFDPALAKIEAACGTISRPAPESSVTMENTGKQWTIVPDAL